jgi:type III secretion system (T3SS) inner membrane Yop/YscD-like protein
LRSSNSSENPRNVAESPPGRSEFVDGYLLLEICRGRTEHPLRPVYSERFLIGSSARCDLRLGGQEIPPVHSLIFVDGPDIWLEAMATTPELRVNGRLETSVRLVDGDRICIGPIELVAHIPAQAENSIHVPELQDVAILEERPEPAANEISAKELVERIEAATELVNQFEERQRLGIEALHAAIQQRENQLASADAPADALLPIGGSVTGRPGVDLDSLVVQLAGVVGELEKRSGAEWRREAGYLDAVSTLFETQDRLSRQLEILLRRVAFLNSDRSSGREQGRAIA